MFNSLIPPSESAPVQTFEEKTEILGMPLYLFGFWQEFAGGPCISGSAAGPSADAKTRAYFEFLERRCIYEEQKRQPQSTSQSWCLAKSNGVALHTSRTEAMQRAKLEFFERDRVLRSWFGLSSRPKAIQITSAMPTAFRNQYETHCVLLNPGEPNVDPHVVGCFHFPTAPDKMPMVYGFAARATISDAQKAAESEALQRLAFLFDEELPAEVPTPQPNALYHQEYFLHPRGIQELQRWLSGNHRTNVATVAARAPSYTEIHTTDISPNWARGQFYVMRAHSPLFLPLIFGVEIPDYRRLAITDVPHPIA